MDAKFFIGCTLTKEEIDDTSCSYKPCLDILNDSTRIGYFMSKEKSNDDAPGREKISKEMFETVNETVEATKIIFGPDSKEWVDNNPYMQSIKEILVDATAQILGDYLISSGKVVFTKVHVTQKKSDGNFPISFECVICDRDE